MKRQSCFGRRAQHVLSAISNVTVPTHRPNHCLSVKSEETQYRERFLVQADNVGATIDFHSCVLLLLLFPRFFSGAFFLANRWSFFNWPINSVRSPFCGRIVRATRSDFPHELRSPRKQSGRADGAPAVMIYRRSLPPLWPPLR